MPQRFSLAKRNLVCASALIFALACVAAWLVVMYRDSPTRQLSVLREAARTNDVKSFLGCLSDSLRQEIGPVLVAWSEMNTARAGLSARTKRQYGGRAADELEVELRSIAPNTLTKVIFPARANEAGDWEVATEELSDDAATFVLTNHFRVTAIKTSDGWRFSRISAAGDSIRSAAADMAAAVALLKVEKEILIEMENRLESQPPAHADLLPVFRALRLERELRLLADPRFEAAP